MKRFEIITEADARVLESGSTVVLVAGGHITPLAHDTLEGATDHRRARRRRIVDAERLAPCADIRTVAIGSDHTGVALKTALREHPARPRPRRARPRHRHDATRWTIRTSRRPWRRPVARGEADAGIVIDGAGLGSAIAANKIAGVRAAMCANETLARYSREHNGANVLALGATLVTPDEALTIVDTFLTTPMREPRYIRRLAKIRRSRASGRADRWTRPTCSA